MRVSNCRTNPKLHGQVCTQLFRTKVCFEQLTHIYFQEKIVSKPFVSRFLNYQNNGLFSFIKKAKTQLSGNDISTTVKDQILRNVWPRSYRHKKSDSSSPHGGCYRTRTYDPLLVRQML